MTIPITGDVLTDALTLLAIAWVGAILLLPGSWLLHGSVRYCYSLLVSGLLTKRIAESTAKNRQTKFGEE